MAQIEAIVLNSIEYKDSSKILNLYTKLGHKSVLAHGVKKHNNINRFLSQNCTRIKLELSDKKLPSLKDGELLDEYENIKKDVYTYSYMNHIMELVNYTINSDSNHEKMFHFLTRLLTLVNDGFDADVASFIFELKLLHFIGYGLNFRGCNICDENENLVFHISSGGVICNHHLDADIHTYGPDIYGILQTLYYHDIDKEFAITLTDTDRIIIRHILDVLYDEFVSFHTKSMKIIKQIEKY